MREGNKKTPETTKKGLKENKNKMTVDVCNGGGGTWVKMGESRQQAQQAVSHDLPGKHHKWSQGST